MVDIVQGTTPASYLYAGTSGGDTYVVPLTRTTTGAAYLSGTYTIDTLGLGNDILVFKVTDFQSNQLFFPQFELVARTTGTGASSVTTYSPSIFALDQRTTPFRINWPNADALDTSRLDVYVTPAGASAAVLAATIDRTNFLIGISPSGVLAAPGTTTGALYTKETI